MSSCWPVCSLARARRLAGRRCVQGHVAHVFGRWSVVLTLPLYFKSFACRSATSGFPASFAPRCRLMAFSRSAVACGSGSSSSSSSPATVSPSPDSHNDGRGTRQQQSFNCTVSSFFSSPNLLSRRLATSSWRSLLASSSLASLSFSLKSASFPSASLYCWSSRCSHGETCLASLSKARPACTWAV